MPTVILVQTTENMHVPSLQTDFNPVAAYRSRGQRYAVFVAAKIAFLMLVFALAILTLGASMTGENEFPLLYRIAMFVLKVAGVLMPYLGLESLYWWYRLRREASAR